MCYSAPQNVLVSVIWIVVRQNKTEDVGVCVVVCVHRTRLRPIKSMSTGHVLEQISPGPGLSAGA